MTRKLLPLPSQVHLLSVFDYEPLTGVLTRKWQADQRACWNSRWAGKEAGTPQLSGVWVHVLGHGLFAAHRVIWKMVYGWDPPEYIDHKDLDNLNNRLVNLRSATHAQNEANSRGWSKNGLPKGVRRNPTGPHYQARITVNGEVVYLGSFPTPEQANQAYLAKARQVVGEFARG